MSIDIRSHGDLTLQAVEAFLVGLNCTRSLTVLILLRNKEYEQLCNLEFKPDDYNCLSDARDSLAATKLLSKASFLDFGRSKREVALLKFYECEGSSLATNQRIRRGTFDSMETHSVLLTAQRIISLIMCDFSPDELVDACNWGPGASTKLKRVEASAPKKV